VTSIGFLEPLFLWGLSFLGLVLLIHLLKRPRTVRLAFSTLRFFSATAVAANRARKLRRLLLLLVRLLLAALLVIIFARPFNTSDPLFPVSDPSTDLFVLLDQTPSMGYREKGEPLYRSAMNAIDSIALLRGGGTGISVFSGADAAFIPWETFRLQPFSLRYADDFRTFGTACAAALQGRSRAVVLLLSDFQRQTTGVLCSLSVTGRQGRVPVIAVPFTPEHPWNLSVESCRVTGGADGSVDVGVAAQGERGGAAKVNVSIGAVRTPSLPCSLAAGADTVVRVPLRISGAREWGTIALQCEDPLQFDNVGYVTAGHTGGYSVLIIGNETANYPISTALRAADTAYWSHCTRRAPDNVTFEELSSADLVIVNECHEPVPPLTAVLENGENRRQAFIIAGNGDTLTDPVWRQVGSLLASRGKPVNQSTALTVKIPDTATGIWREFPTLFCSEVNVYAYRTGLAGTTLLHLSNGVPLLAAGEDRFGRRLVLCGTPLGITSANNLCETGFYVPFIDRVSRHAAAYLAERDEPWVAGMPIRNRWYGSGSPAQLFTADGSRLLLRLQQQQRFSIEVPGVYKVVPPGASPYYKAVIADPRESRCEYRIPDGTGEACGKVSVVVPRTLLSYCREKTGRAWRLLPWGLLVLLLVGELLLRERKKERS
jgi:hypothetical protein